MKAKNIIFSCIIALLPTIVMAQEVATATTNEDKFFFNHLSIGGTIGSTGLGVEVAMPVNKKIALRAGFNVFALGTMKLKLANSMGDIYTFMDLDDKYITESVKNKKVEVGCNITGISGWILADYYPWKFTSFHLTGGFIYGNRNVFHLFNTVDGNMMFSTIANKYVRAYNESFHTAYSEVGLKFGDYIFTADENGNIDARMLVNAVRPYLGIGWGRSIDVYKKRVVRTNFDFGFSFWGRPQFKLNNGEKVVKTGSDEGGALKFLSGFWAWPVMKLTICGDIF